MNPDKTSERVYRYEYTYDDFGTMTKKEVFHWNDQKKAWEPYFCITNSYGFSNNTLIAEYALWDKLQGTYDAPVEKAIYKLNVFGEIIAMEMTKSNELNPMDGEIALAGTKTETPILLVSR